jgi:hypothetical protein
LGNWWQNFLVEGKRLTAFVGAVIDKERHGIAANLSLAHLANVDQWQFISPVLLLDRAISLLQPRALPTMVLKVNQIHNWRA